jgi:hypothetical protein
MPAPLSLPRGARTLDRAAMAVALRTRDTLAASVVAVPLAALENTTHPLRRQVNAIGYRLERRPVPPELENELVAISRVAHRWFS